MLFRILLDIAWLLNLKHVPAYDVDRCELLNEEQQELEEETLEELPEPDGMVITRQVGPSDFGKNTEVVEQLIKPDEDGMGWEIQLFDGSGEFDFRDWHKTDDIAIAELSDHDAKVYRKIRMDVIKGMTNSQIAVKHAGKGKRSMSLRWAEKHAARVRAALNERKRMTKKTKGSAGPGEEPNPSPALIIDFE